MGKKSKAKRHRQHNPASSRLVQPTAQPVSQSSGPSAMLRSSLNQPDASASTPAPVRQAVSPLDMHEYVRRDIVRILTILGIITVIVVGLVVVNHKSTILHRAGNRFARFMQL